jgi:hypothetical protein
MLKKILIIMIPLLVSCQAIEKESEATDLAYFPPVGSVWVVEKKIVAPKRTLNLNIIDGKVHDSFFRWDNYKTSCSLDFKTMTSDEKTIQPTRFVITKVKTREEVINSTTGNFKTIMQVTSADNSYIESITCQSWNSYGALPYVSIDEMQKATKGLMTLEIKKSGEDTKNKNG